MHPTLRILILILLAPTLAGAAVGRPTNPNHTYQGTIFPLAMTLFLPLLALPGALAAGEPSYLTTEAFDLPFNQTERLTTRALAPGKSYDVSIYCNTNNIAILRHGSIVFSDGVRTFSPSSTYPPDERGVVRTLEYLVEGKGHRLAVRSFLPWYVAPCRDDCRQKTLVARLTIAEVLPQPPPPPRNVIGTSTATPSPDKRHATSVMTLTTLPTALALLGCLALAVLSWRVVVHMRRRQLLGLPSVRESRKLARQMQRDTQSIHANTDIARALNTYLRRLQQLLK